MDHCKKEERKKNPREKANVFSLITFAYTRKLFKKGFKNKKLEDDDIYEVLKGCNSKKCGDKTEKTWNETQSLLYLLFSRFGRTYFFLAIFSISWAVCKSVFQPYGMSHFISYFEANQTKISKTDAYYYAGIVIFLNVFHCFYIHNYIMLELKLGIQVRASLNSLMYRKLLKMSPAAIKSTSLGNIVTILTKDIPNIQHNMWIVNDMIMASLQTLTVFYLLYARMGNPAFIGIGLVLVAFPIQLFLSKFIIKMKLKIGRMSDERLQLTQETLSAIRIIKMYTWEVFFNNQICAARRKEITTMLKSHCLTIIITSLGILCSKVTFLILILSYMWMGYTTNTEMIFYVLSLFGHLRESLAVTIPIGLTSGAECYAAFVRISRVLKTENIQRAMEVPTTDKNIEMDGVCVNVGEDIILKNVCFKINSPGLIAVTGPVGCGKTSLLKTILKDYPVTKGRLVVNGSICYASQDPWLFPSSIKQNILFGQELDTRRYNKVLDVCALNFDLGLLENGDNTIVTDKGMNLSKGQQSRVNLARAIYKDGDIYLLDDSLAALDAKVHNHIFKECIKKYLKGKIVVLVTQNPLHIKEADEVILMQNGTVKSVKKPEELDTKYLENEINVVDNKKGDTIIANGVNAKSDKEIPEQDSSTKVYQESQDDGKINYGIYRKYIEFGGGLFVFGLIILVYFVAQFTESYSFKLITTWVDLQQKVLDFQPQADTNQTYYEEIVYQKDFAFNLYATMILVTTALSITKYYAFLSFCRKASINIHEAMTFNIVHSVMDFFDKHFIGNILNRFSHDLCNIDEHLPFMLTELIRGAFGIGGIIVLLTTVNVIFLLVAVIFSAILLLIRQIYMPLGRSLKRLEAINRSPMVGHLNASLEGLTTIRAYKAEQIVANEFDRHQYLYTSTNYMLLMTYRAFGFFMDFFCTVFFVIVICVFLQSDLDTSAGNVGLALIQIFMLTGHVQWTLSRWANLENQMTSVQRVLEYTNIDQEDNSGDTPADWPKNGAIQYENVTLTYNNNVHVLKNISFTAKSLQKIGIVGRTGAGKSSIISTLFRLYKFQGKILIDGVDINSLSLKFLRDNIAIIPQDPVLFTGTIRENIDPYGKYTDEEIWKAIKNANVGNWISELDVKISSLNCSAGQKQLICMARAIINKNKIVILDEATANMDPDMDALIHDTIQENFSYCTLFTIAHRLNTILECDMIMVLDRGQIIQFEQTKVFLENDNNWCKMLEQSNDT